MNAFSDHDPRTRNREPDPQVEERAWAEAAATGDRRAFERLYRRHVDRVYGLCLRLTRDAGEAEQLTQDTFVKAWLAIAGYRGRGPFGGWLGRVATNLWRDRYRARRRRFRLVADSAHERGWEPGDEPRAAMTGHARQTPDGVVPLLTALDLERCVARLPEGARQVYVLHDIEQWTHPEIADLLDVAVGTVKAQLHRARKLLRAMLTDGGPPTADKEASP